MPAPNWRRSRCSHSAWTLRWEMAGRPCSLGPSFRSFCAFFWRKCLDILDCIFWVVCNLRQSHVFFWLKVSGVLSRFVGMLITTPDGKYLLDSFFGAALPWTTGDGNCYWPGGGVAGLACHTFCHSGSKSSSACISMIPTYHLFAFAFVSHSYPPKPNNF